VGRAAALALVLATLSAGCAPEPARPYAGSEACRSCHAAEHRAWTGSLHAAAARETRPQFVQASFDGSAVAASSVAATPQRTAGGYGFEVAGVMHSATLTLGRAQVEQFLVPFAGGRLQAFPVAYDPVEHEWFDVFPEAPAPEAWTHWTGPGATANSQCLECHVTDYAKGYDAATGGYASRWTELGVGCEACHGPGQAHVGVHTAGHGVDPYRAAGARRGVAESCAPCHGLRVVIADGYVPGSDLADHFDFALLDAPDFHADGQLRGEAYEWTSFRQSRMAAEGVTCGDCHTPHAGTLRRDGDALCLQCHEPRLAAPAHTRHEAGSAGSACVGCHMPQVTFMERDERRDHAFTRPDPRRSLAIGSRDACTACHTDRPAGWAAEHVETWYGPGDEARTAQRGLAVLLEAGRRGDPSAAESLARLLSSRLDPVRRATIARLLGSWGEQARVRDALVAAMGDDDAAVRAAATRALGETSLDAVAQRTLVTASRDARRLVRLEAAFALRSVDLAGLSADDRQAVSASFEEWLSVRRTSAELPETHFDEGLFWSARREPARAEAAYRRAVALWPADLTPRQNLALLLLEGGRPGEAQAELEAILQRSPAWPPALLVERTKTEYQQFLTSLWSTSRAEGSTGPGQCFRRGQGSRQRGPAAPFRPSTCPKPCPLGRACDKSMRVPGLEAWVLEV
jgi:predicted CXXCH cytochrome family protein